ncbi:HSP20-like chaperone [Chytridium lagenaria]|nr:HSP20-like chaperone [Chytridium lagenaria]
MTLFARDPFFNDFFQRDPFFQDFDHYLNTRISSAFQDVNRALEHRNTEHPAPDASRQDIAHRPTNRLWLNPSHANDKSYVIHADVPGIKKEELSITLKDDILTISGERKTDNEIKDDRRHVVERSYGKFSRSIQLPQNANADSVAARLQDGVLELSVAKRETPAVEAPRQITIA